MNSKHVMSEKTYDYMFYIGLCLSLVIVFFRFISGQQYFIYEDIGSDTYNQYYPYFLHEVIAIQNGTFSSWIWNYGLGTSIQNVNSWTLDPFGIILVLLGVILGADKVAYLLVWMQIFKIIVVFLLAKRFVSFFSNNRLAVNLGAYAIAMNGYLFLWGQHYSMGTACVYQLVLLIAIEEFIRSDCKKFGYKITLAVALLLIYSFYIGYMILLFSAAYFIYRYLYEIDFKIGKLIKDWFKCIGWVASGTLISSVVFIPASYCVLTNSSRLDGASDSVLLRMKAAFLISFSRSEFLERLSRALSNNSLYMTDNSKSVFGGNYYEDPQLFCSLFIIVFVCVWLCVNCWKVEGVKKKVLHILLVIGCVILAFNSLSGLVMNAFVTPRQRHTFLIFPLLGVAIAQGFDSFKEKNKGVRIAAFIGSIVSMYTWSYIWNNCSEEVRSFAIILGIELFVGCLMLLTISFSARNHRLLIPLFVVVVFFSTIAENYVTTNERDCVTAQESSERVQWDDGEVATDSASAIEWLKEYDTSYYRVEKTYGDWGTLSDSFIEQYSGVAYYNSTPNINVSAYYDNIYANAYNIYAVKLFSVDTEMQERAIDIAAIKYVLSHENSFLDWKMIKQIGGTYIFQNPNVDSIASWYTNGVLQEQFLAWNEDEAAEFLEDGVILDELPPMQMNASAEVGDYSVHGNTLQGTVSCDGDGVLLLSIPDQEGWSVMVDGKETQTVNADFGFIGVPLERGNHNIVAKYTMPQKKLGICASILGLLLFIILNVGERRKQRNEYFV